MVQYALDFSQYTPTSPAVISFSTQGYEAAGIETAMTDFSAVVTNRQLFTGTLSPDYATLSAVSNQVTQIQNIYIVYGYTGDTQLSQNASQVQTDINNLEALINNINADPSGSFTAGTYPSIPYGSPQLNFAFAATPTWGGTGGNEFQDVTSEIDIRSDDPERAADLG